MAPIELITAVGTKAVRTNFAMAIGVANVFVPDDQRLTSHAPTSAARVVPIAMAGASAVSARAKIASAENAPTKIAGQTRYPRSRTRASASPVGGHNGVWVGLIPGNTCAV